MLRPTCCMSLLVAIACAAPASALPQYGSPRKAPPFPPPAEPAAAPSPGSPGKKTEIPPNEARYYERLDAADREALQAGVGFILPAPPADLVWFGGDAMSKDDFRGKVTVIQSIGGRSASRASLEKLRKQLPEGVLLLAVHTPEQAERAKATFEKSPPCLVAIDAQGNWCDALGIWKKPVNLVIDKTGAVRYVGLSDAGLKAKLEPLLAEEVDDSVLAKERPVVKPEAAAKPAEWPVFQGAVASAQDMRGKPMPTFAVDQWITAQPTPGNRLIALDFWATWCGPCRASIPHLNDLNGRYGNDVLFVGISDETKSNFTRGLKDAKLKSSDFSYAIALDPKARLKKGFFGITGIPSMAIISPDGIVRWQGHPMSLQDSELESLIAANRALTKPAADPKARGWGASGAGRAAPATR